MSSGAVTTGSIDRRAGWGSPSTIRRSVVPHVVALLSVAGAVGAVESPVFDFDHGTHLLVVLTLVMGIALVTGPGPATSAFAAGGGLAAGTTLVTVEDAFGSAHAYVQLLTYLLAGSLYIVLVSTVARSRRRLDGPRAIAPGTAPGGAVLPEPLTARELEVLRLAATGIAVDEIARRLFVSPNTAKTHLTHIYAKLGVRGRAEATRAALHYGCLSPGDICPHLLANTDVVSPVPVIPKHRLG